MGYLCDGVEHPSLREAVLAILKVEGKCQCPLDIFDRREEAEAVSSRLTESGKLLVEYLPRPLAGRDLPETGTLWRDRSTGAPCEPHSEGAILAVGLTAEEVQNYYYGL